MPLHSNHKMVGRIEFDTLDNSIHRTNSGNTEIVTGCMECLMMARVNLNRLYALARQIQKHSRRLAVLETLDNGKPIRESRDIDIPLVARHFYYHAGWAQLLDQEFPGYQ